MVCPGCKNEIDRVLVVSRFCQSAPLTYEKGKPFIVDYGRSDYMETVAIECPDCSSDLRSFVGEGEPLPPAKPSAKKAPAQRKVYDAIEDAGRITSAEIAKVLKWSVNRVSSRLVQLRKKGFVVQAGEVYCRVVAKFKPVWRVTE